MTDLELLMVGVVVTFVALSGAYVAIRHRANETPVRSFKPTSEDLATRQVIQPRTESR